MKEFEKMLWVPVWLITLALIPFLPARHPWKHEEMTLESWTKQGTPFALGCSITFWVFWCMGCILAGMLVQLKWHWL